MRSNYSREERQKIVEEYIQSGKSQTVFAPEYGIKPNTLSAWVTKYKSAEALLLLEKMNARLSEKDQKIREQQAEIKILNEKLAVQIFIRRTIEKG